MPGPDSRSQESGLKTERSEMIWPFEKRQKIAFTVPGPSPWYLTGPFEKIKTQAGVWQWKRAEDKHYPGLSYLTSPSGSAVLVVNFQCYVQLLPGDRILIWHESDRGHADALPAPAKVVFTILDLDQLMPLADTHATLRDVHARKIQLHFEAGNPQTFEFATSIPEGTHAFSPPSAFGHIPELLVLADFGSEGRSNWERAFRAIFAFDFHSRQVQVMPQAWFNEGGMDYGYQWITRVQREPATGRIVGEGIRLGNFRLDASGTRVQEWLHKDVFYHPERDI